MFRPFPDGVEMKNALKDQPVPYEMLMKHAKALSTEMDAENEALSRQQRLAQQANRDVDIDRTYNEAAHLNSLRTLN
jgi:hypothetical protein